MFVVTGVTEQTGSGVAEALLSRRKQVRVVLRDTTQETFWKQKGAEVSVATLKDAQALATALEGAQGAFLMLPPLPPDATHVLSTQHLHVEALALALKSTPLCHAVLLSSIGAQHAQGTGPLRAFYDAEQRLGALGTPLTFVRAAFSLEHWARALSTVLQDGVLPSFLSPKENKVPMVAHRDVGEVCARMLLDPVDTHRVVELSGPHDLSPKDLAEGLERILRRPVQLKLLPLHQVPQVFQAHGYSAEQGALYQELYEALHLGLLHWEGQGAQSVKGGIPIETSLRELVANAQRHR